MFKHHLFRGLLTACLLLASTALWAADEDGDSVPDVAPTVTQIRTGWYHTCSAKPWQRARM